MDPITASVIMGGMQAGTSMIGANMQQRASQGMASDMMNFQERMSSTAMQRSKADMDAAGFNPILAMPQGASTPGGAMGEATNQLEGIGQGIATGAALRAQNKELELKDKQIEGQTAQIANVKADTLNKGAQTAGILNQNELTAKQARGADLGNQLSQETMKDVIKELKARGKWAEAQQVMKLTSSGVSTAKDAAAIVGELVGGLPKGAIKGSLKGIKEGLSNTINKGQLGN